MRNDTCLNCGKKFKPENRKKFCGSTCRSYFNFKLKMRTPMTDGEAVRDDPMQRNRQKSMDRFLSVLRSSGRIHVDVCERK